MRRAVFNFGKHRGSQVDDTYLQWIANEFPQCDSWWKKAAGALTSRESEKINVRDLLSELKHCTRKRDLLKGKGLHADAVKAGIDSNIYVAAAFISLYTKCGSINAARTVFDSIQEPDAVSWTAIILGYANKGEGLVALDLFSRMKSEGKCAPDSFTYVAALKACTLLATDGGEAGKKECLERGRQIHSDIGHHMDLFTQNTLINLYGKCGSMEDARIVFDSIRDPDVVSWTAIILGYADNGQGSLALDLFSKMKQEGRCAPDSVIYIAALKACSLLAGNRGDLWKGECLEMARQIHSEIGSHMNHFAQSTLINLYGKCGSMEDARNVFNSIQEPDVVCWNALILGYAENGKAFIALNLFSSMKDKGLCIPNSVTYLVALKACTMLPGEAGKRECLERGRQIHLEIGCHMTKSVQNTLINLYGSCGSMEGARKVFDSMQDPDGVSWNAIILGYTENGESSIALGLFSRMKGEGKCTPDSITYLGALKACTLLAADGGDAEKRQYLERGRQIHSEIGCHMSHAVQTTLINLYAKCGSMKDARTVFDSIQKPDVVSWTAIILGYADNGQGLVALDLFSRMKEEDECGCNCAPDSFSYVAVLKACCSVGALAIGRRIHSVIREFDSHVVTCLVDFYAKCGNIEEAREVFDSHPQLRDASTWTALLAGYAQFGDTDSVFSLFEAMQDQGCQPNAVTFVCILSCCSHAGLIEKAWEYLEIMPIRYGITPSVMHYSCMIDLLGRANKLDEAVALLEKMPCYPNAVTWIAVLAACSKWKNIEIGKWAFKSLMDLDYKNASVYVLMAEIYGSGDMWEEQERVLESRMKFGACRLAGQAYVMDGLGRMAKFVVGEEDCADVQDKVLKSMKERGYVSESYSISGDEIHEKEKALCGHSERRAVFYGILNTPPGEVIRVVKNMRTCNDCHFVTKMISKITGRVIMIRDETRFHIMENGICACKDYF